MKQNLIAVVLPVGMLLCSCDKTARQTDADAPMTVTVAYPEVDSIVLHKEFPAFLTSENETEIVARVNGYIVAKKFVDGEYVKAGQPLFIIESTTYVDNVNKAEAALQSAIAQNEYAAKQYEAMLKAIESDAVSKMDLNQAESNLRESEAAVNTAKAQLQTARTMLGYCTTRAPYDCYVAKPTVNVNDYVAGESSPMSLVKVYDNRHIYVNFSIDNDTYQAMTQTAAGRRVDLNRVPVHFNDTIMTTYYGQLDYASPMIDKSTGTVTLRLIVDNPDNELRSGMFAVVQLPYAVSPHALLVNDASLGTDQLGHYLYTVNDSNTVVYTPVEVGELYHDSLRVITSGIHPTARYVTDALLKVRDGAKVKPVSGTDAVKK